MKVILVDQHHGHTRTIVLKGWLKGILSLCLVGAPFALGYLGYHVAVSQGNQFYSEEAANNWDATLQLQAQQLAEVKQKAEEQMEALTVRLAMLQVRMVRLDAVGERITSVANLDSGEFDFTNAPAIGGPENEFSTAYEVPEFISAVRALEDQIADREQQLEILEGLLVDRKIQSDIFIAGRPIEKGWISSRYGRRADPFTGRQEWHSGVDFATGKLGSNINTVASGVVVWSGARSGYGLVIDVNHGNGYTTRYAHAEKLLADVGDVVKKGQTVALVGSTGRSTGPHVHFEVYKNGRVVDPASYIHRTAR